MAGAHWPSLQSLLLAGGDDRLMLDPETGRSRYGSRPFPDPELVALGSSTASIISGAGHAAAQALHAECARQLQQHSPAFVYATQAERLRRDLLALCGTPDASVVLAASGTDLHLLAGQWLRPDCIIMIAPAETGSGLPAALQGKHPASCAAHSTLVPAGVPLDEWRPALITLSARAADGSLRDPVLVDAECIAHVSEVVAAGRSVLLVLTDLSKTGLLVPGVDTVLALQQRWPQQVTVLVDACQFRLAAATVRAYLAQGFLVAITGSKFVGGPTFCGALLVPSELALRYRDVDFAESVGAYSCAADWPSSWRCGQSLPVATNFGLLLRWQAAMVELTRFHALPDEQVTAILREFGAAIRRRVAASSYLEALPVTPVARGVLTAPVWDREQTVFPLLLKCLDGRYLTAAQTRTIHQQLMAGDSGQRRFQLGQAVACGARDGLPVMALRVCVSAPMVVAAAAGMDLTADALAALDALESRVKSISIM
ncbi:hypothetical protein [Actimicrobium antarcticum]|uniref:Aminotransferase class V domain-containing protein n=1 Tax=Actimicrobium antarcticum TaxID=1051899 RepID=A0ABP7SI12_9BURK